MYQSAMNIYKQANYFTASPARLVVMCYEGAVNNLKVASDAYRDKDFESKGKALQKALDIIHELNASLDMEKGGEIAKNLRSLYLFLIKSLTEADLKADIKTFEKSIGMLEELAGVWRTIEAVSDSKTVSRPGKAEVKEQSQPARKLSLAAAWS